MMFRRTVPHSVLAVSLLVIPVAFLVSCGAAPTGATNPAATPTLDPTAQAYVSMLRTYYVPTADANTASLNCFLAVQQASVGQQAQAMADCRSPFAAQLADARTLLTQLAAATPPVRWQTQHVALQQAVHGLITLLTEQLAAVNAGDVTRLMGAKSLAITSLPLFCAPIAQLNAGPPPLAPPLHAPDPSFC
jgi:hypothetical protein